MTLGAQIPACRPGHFETLVNPVVSFSGCGNHKSECAENAAALRALFNNMVTSDALLLSVSPRVWQCSEFNETPATKHNLCSDPAN